MNKLGLMARIDKKYNKMSKGQRLIADYIMKNYDKAAFMTASKLGKTVGVSESTVVRFANMLEYEGYPDQQKALQELVRNKLTTVQRLEMTTDLDKTTVLKNVLKADMNNIRSTINSVDDVVFEQVVNKILAAKNIYILGLRSTAPIAEFMGYYLNLILSNVRVVTSGINDVLEQLIHISKDDLLIAISFPRYASRAVDAIGFSKNRGASTVTITDSHVSPLATYADYCLLAKSDMASFVDSLVAPLSLINALVVAVGIFSDSDISTYFNELEKIWDMYSVYKDKEKND
ncbi:MAG: MurR/RpiR family transcriptional regulator [Caldicoprobacterales bacterium]|jgi:DNA-binding MurR/RpiR family transcriptional regulator